MAETQEETLQQAHHEGQVSEKGHGAPFSVWPPSQRTRDAVISRLVETLSTPPRPVLLKRYGTVPSDEAPAAARVIEEEAFSAVSASASGVSATANEGGIEILQAYSKEISKRVLEVLKSRAAVAGSDTPFPATSVSSEAFSSVETDSS